MINVECHVDTKTKQKKTGANTKEETKGDPKRKYLHPDPTGVMKIKRRKA